MRSDVVSANDRARLMAVVDELADAFVRLVESAPEPSRPVPASPAWTVRDVAAHMATVVPRYAEGPRGEGRWVDDPADLPALNDELVRDLGPAPVAELTGAIRRHTVALLDQVGRYGPEPPTFGFNGGEPVRADRALGLLAGELLVHGHDVAEVVGAPWPIRPDHVEYVLDVVEDVLPGFVHPERGRDHTAAYDIRLRGGGRHVWSFGGGRLDCHADPAAVRIDCRLSGDPAALLLVMYGRRSPWRAALTGQVAAWGRRPWLALSLPDRFHNP